MKEVNDLVDSASAWRNQHRVAQRNPKKLLAAKGAAECTAVGSECSAIMTDLEAKFKTMRSDAFAFLDVIKIIQFNVLYDASREERKKFEICFAAVYYVVAAVEFSISPTAMKSHGVHGPEIARYFALERELENLVDKGV